MKLLLDVDGPINVDSPLDRTETFYVKPTRDGIVRTDKKHKVFTLHIDPGLGELLTVLDIPMMWASTWEYNANSIIAPIIHVPILPVIEFSYTDRYDVGNLYWKTKRVVKELGNEPFIWLDDEVTKYDRKYIVEHAHPLSRAITVSSKTGITPEICDEVSAWKKTVELA